MPFKYPYIKRFKVGKVIKGSINLNLNLFIYNKVIKSRQSSLKTKIKTLLKTKLTK